MKNLATLPGKSFCGLDFGNNRWSKHLHSCSMCQQEWARYREQEDRRIRSEWKEPCHCGCGIISPYGKKFVNGHGHKIWTEQQKLVASKRMRLRPPMANLETRKKNGDAQRGIPRPWQMGDRNPSRRLDVRKKISQNNPMKNAESREKQTAACRTIKERSRRSLFMREHSCQFDPQVVVRRVDTYTKRLSEGRYHLKNNWKTGFYTRQDGKQEWYDSSYELSRMRYYDEQGIAWTKKHKIRIAYTSAEGRATFYVPDFLITIHGGRCVIDEIKGWLKEADKIKAKIAIDFCKSKGWWYRLFLGRDMVFVNELSYIGV